MIHLKTTASVLHSEDAHLERNEVRLGKSIFFVVLLSPPVAGIA
jgi:hypothetical protein